MKMILKVLALPVLFVVTIACILGNLITNISSYVIALLLLIIAGCSIYCIIKALWTSLAILAGMGLAAILIIFLLVWAVVKLETLGNHIKEFISSYECDPVMLIKIPFIQYLYGIKSMRQTMKEIEVNVAYRWFLGLDMLDPVPHFSTFGKNYTRRFKDTDLFEQIFSKILEKRGWNPASFYWLF